jgi:uncharacterized protein (DUF1778 family)
MSVLANENKSMPRAARIGLRATQRQQVLIRRAAEAANKSVTEFILDSACAAAEDTLLNQRLFLLNDVNWQKFQDTLERPAKVKTGLKELLKENAPWE